MRSTSTFQMTKLRLREAQLQPSENWREKWKGWPLRGNRVPEGRVRVPQSALSPRSRVGGRASATLVPPTCPLGPGAGRASPLSPGPGWGGRLEAGRSAECRRPAPSAAPSAAGGGSSPGLPGRWLRFWFHFSRPGLSVSLSLAL